MQNSKKSITQLLNDYSNGNRDVLISILPLVYDELKKISSRYLRDEYRNHTFQTTELHRALNIYKSYGEEKDKKQAITINNLAVNLHY